MKPEKRTQYSLSPRPKPDKATLKLDHVTIRTSRLIETRDFLLELFGLQERARPRALAHIPGYWLYAGDSPIIHLIGVEDGADTIEQKEAWDHVGFRLTDHAGLRYKLDRLGIPYSAVELPELAESRLFFRTPGGMLIEAVFSTESAQ